MPAASMPRPASRWMRMRDPSGLNNSIVAPAMVVTGATWSTVAGSWTKVGLTSLGLVVSRIFCKSSIAGRSQ